MNNVKSDINKFLAENNVTTLATVSRDGKPWVCTVYYGVNDAMEMYIVTGIDTEHGKHLKENVNVAFNIYDSHITITQDKYGIQGRGACNMVTNPIEIVKGLVLWHKANPGVEAKITAEDIIKTLKSSETSSRAALASRRVYKIVPSYLKFFNKKLYGEKAYGILQN